MTSGLVHKRIGTAEFGDIIYDVTIGEEGRFALKILHDLVRADEEGGFKDACIDLPDLLDALEKCLWVENPPLVGPPPTEYETVSSLAARSLAVLADSCDHCTGIIGNRRGVLFAVTHMLGQPGTTYETMEVYVDLVAIVTKRPPDNDRPWPMLDFLEMGGIDRFLDLLRHYEACGDPYVDTPTHFITSVLMLVIKPFNNLINARPNFTTERVDWHQLTANLKGSRRVQAPDYILKPDELLLVMRASLDVCGGWVTDQEDCAGLRVLMAELMRTYILDVISPERVKRCLPVSSEGLDHPWAVQNSTMALLGRVQSFRNVSALESAQHMRDMERLLLSPGLWTEGGRQLNALQLLEDACAAPDLACDLMGPHMHRLLGLGAQSKAVLKCIREVLAPFSPHIHKGMVQAKKNAKSMQARLREGCQKYNTKKGFKPRDRTSQTPPPAYHAGSGPDIIAVMQTAFAEDVCWNNTCRMIQEDRAREVSQNEASQDEASQMEASSPSANRLKRCMGCRIARYCSQECQKAHWSVHKVDCKLAQGLRAVEKSDAFEKRCEEVRQNIIGRSG